MAQGIQIFGPNGELVIDTSDRIMRLHASGQASIGRGVQSVWVPVPGMTGGADFCVTTMIVGGEGYYLNTVPANEGFYAHCGLAGDAVFNYSVWAR